MVCAIHVLAFRRIRAVGGRVATCGLTTMIATILLLVARIGGAGVRVGAIWCRTRSTGPGETHLAAIAVEAVATGILIRFRPRGGCCRAIIHSRPIGLAVLADQHFANSGSV